MGDSAPRGGRGQRALRSGLRLLGPVALVLLVARMKDRGAVLEVLRSALGWPLAAVLALNGLSIHVKVLRWRALLRGRGVVYPLRRAWACYLATSYVGLLTPGRVGDVLRAHYLRHDLGVPYAEGLASVVMDRLCDLYVLVALVGLSLVRFRAVLAGRLAYLTWITMALIVLCPLLLLVPGLAEGAARRLHARLARGAEVEAGTALFLRALRGSIGYGLFFPLALTVLAFGVNFFQGHLLARSLGMDIPFQDVGGLLAIASLLGLVPISLSGLGVREVIFALVFPLLGYPASSGVGFGLLIFAALYLFVVLLGFVGWQLAPPPVGPAPGREDGPVAAGRADAEAEATGTSRGARLFQR